MERDTVLIRIRGKDTPGIFGGIATILANSNANIIDVNQAVLKDMLVLYFIVDMNNTFKSKEAITGELLYYVIKHNLSMDVKEYKGELEPKKKRFHVLTYIARNDRPGIFAKIAVTLGKNNVNIYSFKKLSKKDFASQEIIIDTTGADLKKLKEDLMNITKELNLDFSFQVDDIFRKNKRLIVFDVDSTLLDGEGLNEIAKEVGLYNEIAEITKNAMEGKISFQESFRQRISMLKGVTTYQLDKVKKRINPMHGAKELIQTLKRLGFRTAAISGGLSYFNNRLMKELGMDYVCANKIEIKNGAMTGEVSGRIIDGSGKEEVMRRLAKKEGIPLSQVVAVGDGANDKYMVSAAGLGIAFAGKDVLKEVANAYVSIKDLRHILFMLGISHEDVESLLYDK